MKIVTGACQLIFIRSLLWRPDCVRINVVNFEITNCSIQKTNALQFHEGKARLLNEQFVFRHRAKSFGEILFGLFRYILKFNRILFTSKINWPWSEWAS